MLRGGSRPFTAVVAMALAAALAAAVLAEYDLGVVSGVGAGGLLGLGLRALASAGSRGGHGWTAPLLRCWAAAAGAAALVVAGWLAAGQGIRPIGPGPLLGAAAAMLAGALRDRSVAGGRSRAQGAMVSS